MKKRMYSSSQDEGWSVADEYSTGQEICAPAKEYPPVPEYPVWDAGKEYDSPGGPAAKEEGTGGKRAAKKAMMFLKTSAVLAAVTVVFASYGVDYLGEDYLKDPYGPEEYLQLQTGSPLPQQTPPPEEPPPEEPPPETEIQQEASPSPEEPQPEGETADGAFPVLKNLEPNGVTDTPYGVLDEEFICITHPATGESEYILLNSANTYYTVVSIDGISYDRASNTLTLDNYSGDRLVANLMGNGFKLRLIGENSLQQILIWGFHYGGSLTVTGEGSLTVNGAGTESFGIFFEGESSQTCLMIDKDVCLDIYGTTSAIVVKETTMEKSIYYLSPQVLTGGRRGSEQEDGLFYGYIEDEAGELSKHVTFSPKGG